jgi:hypothetical protein
MQRLSLFDTKKLRHAANLPGRRGHELWADRMVNILAENGLDCGEIALFE